MKRLSVIRLEKYRTNADMQQHGLLPSELDMLLSSSQPEKAPAREGHREKKKTSARRRKGP